MDTLSLSTTTHPGNRHPKPKRIPNSKKMLFRVRKFIRNRRIQKTRVVAKDVLNLLCDDGHVHVGDSPKGQEAALRSVRRYLLRRGFKRGIRKGSQFIEESQRVKDLRTKYLAALRDNEVLPTSIQRRIVDLDESYIHQHHHQPHSSLFDPADNQDVQPRLQQRGQRYSFIAAIWNAKTTKKSFINLSC